MWLYRLIFMLALPAICLRLWAREGRAALAERLGGGAAPAPGPALWLHAASNGELASARPLIEALLADRPDARLVITVNTLTARQMGRSWALARTDIRLAPVDARPVLRRFLARHAPASLISVEAELWPERFAAMEARGAPVLLVSARLSGRALARWCRLPGLARRLIGAIVWAAPQERASARRLAALGLPEARIGPVCNLKLAATAAPAPDGDEMARLAPHLPRDTTILAVSTHEGEERAVLSAFGAARAARPGLKLILAPRHPRRRRDIARAVAAAGVAVRLRSAGDLPDADAPVLIADTMGETALWYRLASVAFVGGSLTGQGGHTPVEPALAGCAILHGPEVANFADLYAALDAAGGAREVADACALGRAFAGIDAAQAAAMAARARRSVDAARAEAGETAPILAALARLAAPGGGRS